MCRLEPCLRCSLPLCSVGGPWFAAIPEELWADVDVSVTSLKILLLHADSICMLLFRCLPLRAIQTPAPLHSAAAAPLFPNGLQPDKVKEDFEPGTGDRRQELVFIGIGMKASARGGGTLQEGACQECPRGCLLLLSVGIQHRARPLPPLFGGSPP